MYAELNAKDTIVINIPYFRYFINEIGFPCAAAVSETITFAAAPMIVMLPPRHAPRERHHQRG